MPHAAVSHTGGLSFVTPWLVLALTAALGVYAAWLWWAYRRAGGLAWGERLACVAARVLGMGLLALCLAEPHWISARVMPRENAVLVVADDSRSMTSLDAGETLTRLEQVQHALAQPWLERLEHDFDVRRYQFERRVELVQDWRGLTGSGWGTDLSSMLTDLCDRAADKPVAGLVLLTDGIATGGPLDEVLLARCPPIFPAVPHANPAAPVPVDLAVAKVTASTTEFEDAPATLMVEVARSALDLGPVVVEVRNEAGERLTEQMLPVGGSLLETMRLEIRPPRAGVSFFEVRAVLADERDLWQAQPGTVGAPERPAGTREATWQNNSRWLAIDRGRGPYRLLYVSGRPNWDYKFLSRALATDDQLQLTALIRVARKEPKFDFRGRAGEATNPLFRGFGADGEDAERYDQPVIVRLNTRDAQELKEGFPKLATELFPFVGVVLDDVEAEFFTTEQQLLLERFVSQRGGSVLMLGGAESFRQGNYQKTPIGRMLPVYLDGSSPEATTPATDSAEGYRLQLTREGWLQPAVRLRRTEPEEKTRLARQPAFQLVNLVGRAKPGAIVALEATSPEGPARPALVWQRFGQGRTAAALVGDFWRWPLHAGDDPQETEDPARAWRQLVRDWIADVPLRWEARRTEVRGEETRLEIRVRTEEFLPAEDAEVRVAFQTPQGPRSVTSDPSLEEIGLWTVTIPQGDPGLYRATVTVRDDKGTDLGERELGWVEQPATEEWRRLQMDRAPLEMMARATGGRVLELGELEAFARQLPQTTAPRMETRSSPLWHSPWWLLPMLVCLCGEWGWRRWRGLV